MKIKIFYLTAFFLWSFIFFITGEIFTRFFFKGIINYPPNGQTIDPYKANPYILRSKQYIHSHYPNVEYIQSRSNFKVSYKINSYGFRENDFLGETEKKRILVVGDSLVEGHGVEYEETFTHRLKKRFEKENANILNLGIQGTSFIVHATNLARFLKLEPDTIIFCISENDWIDDRLAEISYNDLPVLENPSLLDKSYPKFVFKFKLIEFIYKSYYQYVRPKTDIEKITRSNFKKLSTLVSGKEELYAFSENRVLKEDKAEINFQLTRKYFDYIIEECEKRKIKILFINLTHLVYAPNFENKKNKEFIFNSNILFRSYIKNKNIPYMEIGDVAQDYYKKYPDKNLFILDDGHPTKEAHALFAEKITEWLEKLIL